MPKWKDDCQHPCESFIGTETVVEDNGEVLFIDVYVFNKRVQAGQDVCIRFGDDGPDYFSPGSLFDFLLRASPDNRTYWAAAKLIKNHGQITYKKND